MSPKPVLTVKQAAIRTRNLLSKYPKGMRFPAYRFHKRSGRAVIQYRPLFGDNPKYLKGAYGSDESLADYEAMIALVVKHQTKQQPARTAAQPQNVTVRTLVVQFFKWAESYHGQGRELSHLKRAARPLVARYRTKQVRTIGPLRLKKVREDMIDKGWFRSGVNAQFNRLRQIFAWGVEHELVRAKQLAALRSISPLRAGKTRAPEKPKVKPVDWSDAEPLLAVLPPSLSAMVTIQYLTGMRSDELTTMSVDEIEFRADAWVYKPARHKTAHRGRIKQICLGPKSQDALIPYLLEASSAAQRRLPIFSPRIAQRERFSARAAGATHKRYGNRAASTFQPANYRDRYDTVSYHHALEYGFRKLDRVRGERVLRWHPHQLRHTRATLTRELYSIEGSQSQLGNSAEATAIYAEKSLPLAIKIAIETG